MRRDGPLADAVTSEPARSTAFQSEPDAPRPHLPGFPPPRRVPLGLWCQMLVGPVVLAAAGLFAFGMTFVLYFTAGAAPWSALMLGLNHREAGGRLEAVKPTNFSEGDDDGPSKRINRYEYTFDLPGGGRVRGHSYATELPAGGLVIEYDPRHPERNRIRGTRTSPYGSGSLFILIFPAVALLVVVGGVQTGRRTLRLLRHGTPALATMTTCATGGEDSTEVPVAEYKRQMASIRFPGMGGVLALAHAFRVFWVAGVVIILLFGLIVIAGGLIFLAFALTQSAQALPMLIGFLGFGAVWVTVGVFMLRAGGVSGRRVSGWQACCVFEFRPPEGEPVQVRGAAMLHPDEAEEPPQPVLYDPADPKDAVLLSEVAPRLGVSPERGWEAPGGLLALGRVAAVALLLTAPVLAWLFMPSLVQW